MPEGQISVISIPVRDQEKSRRFYEEKLGFEVVSDTMMNGLRWVMLKPPGSSTAITLVTWFREMKPGSLRGIILSVPDIEAAIKDLKTRKLQVDRDTIQEAPWGKWVSLEDPDGNGWIIQQDLLMENAPQS